MGTAARYYQRSQRYVFRPGDRSLMRFAGMSARGEAVPAQVHDLSATGISFVIDGEDTPAEGEILKVEFGIPGRKQIAWFATVVRIETRRQWHPDFGDRVHTLVALKFRQLPKPFHRAIELSIEGRNIDNPEDSENWSQDFKGKPVVAVACLTFALAFTFYMMVLPLSAWFRFSIT